MKYGVWGAATLLLLSGSNTLAAGFAISGKSASNMGNAFSGTSVLAEDASVVFSNPAAMQDLQGRHFSLALHSVNSQLQFTDESSNTTGPSGSDVNDPHYVPNLYFVDTLREDVRFGFGIYAPFGLGLEYDRDWKGRYLTTKSALQIVNFSPAISVKVSNKLNIGAGVDFQYLNAELSNAIDFGTLCYAYEALGAFPANTCVGNGMAPQGNDGSQTLTGSNWAVGYSLGLTYDIDEATRFGMSFHSSTRHDVSGTSDFSSVPALFSGIFTDTDAELTLVLPESLSFGFSRMVSPRLQLMADASWTRWSRYDALIVEFANNVPTSTIEQNWKDSWRISFGGNYRMSNKWLLRAGISHDQTPIPDAQHRSPRVPGASRKWLTLGSNVIMQKGLDMDLALAYTLPTSYKIDNTNNLGNRLNGEYESEILYATIQLNWQL